MTSCSGLSEGQSHGPLPGLLMQEWGPRSGGCLLPGAQCHRGGAAGERPTALATVSEGCVRAPQRHRGGLRVTTALSARPQHPSHSLRAGPQGALSRGSWTSFSPLWRADRCTVSCRSWHHRWGAGGPLEGSQQPTTRFQEHPSGISGILLLCHAWLVTSGVHAQSQGGVSATELSPDLLLAATRHPRRTKEEGRPGEKGEREH